MTVAVELEYVPLDLQEAGGELPLGLDLYIREAGQYLLYRAASSPLPLTRRDCRRLLVSGVKHLWIRIPEEGNGPQQVMNALALPDAQLPPRVKAQIWYGSAKAIAQRAITTSLSPDTLAEVRDLIDVTVTYLAWNASAFPALLSATLHDYSLYTHAVNVAVYALAISKSLGITAEKDLRDLGLAAFMHDVGKAKVAKEVLFKPGPLSPEEWTSMREHPLWGAELLSQATDLPELVLTVVTQHHERLDGSGYPKGLAREEIDTLSMVVAIADAFDAMTCARPYKHAFTPFEALSLLKNEMQVGKLDPDLFVRLVLTLGHPWRVGRHLGSGVPRLKVQGGSILRPGHTGTQQGVVASALS